MAERAGQAPLEEDIERFARWVAGRCHKHGERRCRSCTIDERTPPMPYQINGRPSHGPRVIKGWSGLAVERGAMPKRISRARKLRSG